MTKQGIICITVLGGLTLLGLLFLLAGCAPAGSLTTDSWGRESKAVTVEDSDLEKSNRQLALELEQAQQWNTLLLQQNKELLDKLRTLEGQSTRNEF